MIEFIQLLFSVIVFVVVDVWYAKKQKQLKWKLHYRNNGSSISIKIFNISGDKAKGLIYFYKLSFKDQHDNQCSLDKNMFVELNNKMPAFLNNECQLVTCQIYNKELMKALKKSYRKLYHENSINHGSIIGEFILSFSNGSQVKRLHIPRGFAGIKVVTQKSPK